mmetsp:Transcript_4034/g.14105  ORF Transcript_4034/g.14105 Transcript_4034/m.14105 type:complete len:473 (+) Transcript_4034:56-1474(+)
MARARAPPPLRWLLARSPLRRHCALLLLLPLLGLLAARAARSRSTLLLFLLRCRRLLACALVPAAPRVHRSRRKLLDVPHVICKQPLQLALLRRPLAVARRLVLLRREGLNLGVRHLRLGAPGLDQLPLHVRDAALRHGRTVLRVRCHVVGREPRPPVVPERLGEGRGVLLLFLLLARELAQEARQELRVLGQQDVDKDDEEAQGHDDDVHLLQALRQVELAGHARALLVDFHAGDVLQVALGFVPHVRGQRAEHPRPNAKVHQQRERDGVQHKVKELAIIRGRRARVSEQRVAVARIREPDVHNEHQGEQRYASGEREAHHNRRGHLAEAWRQRELCPNKELVQVPLQHARAPESAAEAAEPAVCERDDGRQDGVYHDGDAQRAANLEVPHHQEVLVRPVEQVFHEVERIDVAVHEHRHHQRVADEHHEELRRHRVLQRRACVVLLEAAQLVHQRLEHEVAQGDERDGDAL